MFKRGSTSRSALRIRHPKLNQRTTAAALVEQVVFPVIHRFLIHEVTPTFAYLEASRAQDKLKAVIIDTVTDHHRFQENYRRVARLRDLPEVRAFRFSPLRKIAQSIDGN